MPRPAVEKTLMRQRFVMAAEEILRENGGARLALADVAARLGMSQSNSYRYFPDRQALISMLAENWFAGVEDEVTAAVVAESEPDGQVTAWVLRTMRAKCERYDADPSLFLAYLRLAGGEAEAVARHVGRLREIIRPAVATLTGETEAEDALILLEDATILFRNPFLIAQYRATLSEKRARQVAEAIIQAISQH
ncbi:TetR family transcriptional regulator [Sinorhizobium medicae]|uniref:TetR family transcriptional regulator n=2 Tax=Sinorhizobium medicae TaxID=110321 RepID=A0A508X0T3_9HYPH|nr:TetR/AcrR family transcriptional regulator [Sinorhizobium medicae]ABR59217.1 transcriptional regulator, TetR family [Sinorhizobium medicae WSM419]MDX0406240.1 TetR family transcriptional regulator [Sinorhizobium medicae]MDX0413007.1 TetR family transcriptional regulator [Sinorhizobium medicae]MDX0417979.1 TetR family transcriptional regulator [Sinorhizobium medicae]MDX0422398.1 TetR family transcriptional regulator [Sinorhizobium medicae]